MKVGEFRDRFGEVVLAEGGRPASETQLEFDVVGRKIRAISEHRASLPAREQLMTQPGGPAIDGDDRPGCRRGLATATRAVVRDATVWRWRTAWCAIVPMDSCPYPVVGCTRRRTGSSSIVLDRLDGDH